LLYFKTSAVLVIDTELRNITLEWGKNKRGSTDFHIFTSFNNYMRMRHLQTLKNITTLA